MIKICLKRPTEIAGSQPMDPFQIFGPVNLSGKDAPFPETSPGSGDGEPQTLSLLVQIFDNAVDLNEADHFRYQDCGLVGDFKIIVRARLQPFYDSFSVFLNAANEENRCGREGLAGAY